MNITPRKAFWLRYSIELGRVFAEYAHVASTLYVMNFAKGTIPRRYRKVMVDVYHRNR